MIEEGHQAADEGIPADVVCIRCQVDLEHPKHIIGCIGLIGFPVSVWMDEELLVQKGWVAGVKPIKEGEGLQAGWHAIVRDIENGREYLCDPEQLKAMET